MKKTFQFAAALLLLTGCDEGARGEPGPEQLALREAAWVQACAAREIEAVAEDDIETIESALASGGDDPVAELTRRASAAALDFALAFERHAELRTSAYAYLDSAVNHAATTADSARYVARSGSFSIRAPQPGSVEANVLESYQERLQAIVRDDDHRCNWDNPF